MSSQDRPSRRNDPVYLCAILFGIFDFVIWRFPWFLNTRVADVIIGLVLAQLSLASLFAIKSDLPNWARYLLIPAATLSLWGFMLLLVFQESFEHRGTGFWYLAFALHGAMVAGFCMLHSVYQRRHERSTLTFRVSSLFWWTAVLALGFAVWQVGKTRGEWYIDFDKDLDFLLPLLGLAALTAVSAVCIIWILFRRLSRFRGDSAILVTCLLCVLFVVIGVMASKSLPWEIRALVRPAVTHAGALTVALLVYRFVVNQQIRRLADNVH